MGQLLERNEILFICQWNVCIYVNIERGYIVFFDIYSHFY